MVRILQWYLFRELGKTFLLTAVGVSAVLGMGGGVLNMIDLTNVGPGQLLRLMSIVLPVAITLALPVAALFSAAVVYGRFSADNEFVACRASGINIHTLFGPSILISLVTAAVTFTSFNFWIPDRVRQLDEFVRDDVAEILVRHLQAPQRLPLGGGRYRIYAERPRAVEQEELPPGSAEVLLAGVAFAEVAQDRWVRYGTAEWARIRFDDLREEPTIKADLHGLRWYDAKQGGWQEFEYEPVSQAKLTRSIPLKVKWLDLRELLYYRTRIGELPEVQEDIDRLRALLARDLFYQGVARDFAEPDARGLPDGEVSFGDQNVQYRLIADELRPDPHDRRPLFVGVRVLQLQNGREWTIRADNAKLTVEPRDRRAYLEVHGNVVLRAGDKAEDTVTKSRETLTGVELPEDVIRTARSISDEELLEGEATVGRSEAFLQDLHKVGRDRGKALREVISTLHARMALSVSALVLVLLAAALGIVLRGSHVVIAFGISFVPSLFVIAAIIAGRQLARNESTMMYGLMVIWAGIAVVALLDVLMLAKVVKR